MMPSMRRLRASRRAANEDVLRQLRQEQPSPVPSPRFIAAAVLAAAAIRIAMNIGKP